MEAYEYKFVSLDHCGDLYAKYKIVIYSIINSLKKPNKKHYIEIKYIQLIYIKHHNLVQSWVTSAHNMSIDL